MFIVEYTPTNDKILFQSWKAAYRPPRLGGVTDELQPRLKKLEAARFREAARYTSSFLGQNPLQNPKS